MKLLYLPENGTSLNRVEPRPRNSPLYPSNLTTSRKATLISANSIFKNISSKHGIALSSADSKP